MTLLTSIYQWYNWKSKGSNIKPSQHLKQRLYSSETQRITEEDKIVSGPLTIALVWYGNLSCISKGATMIYPKPLMLKRL
jgi:hypothetical protein